MKVQTIKLSKITPYENNPRDNEEAIQAVVNSITQHGYVQPITVDSENVIITGHTRYEALKQLGWEKVPVIVLELSKEKTRKYRIADNKVREKTIWDEDKLWDELRSLQENMKDFYSEEEIHNIEERNVGETVKPVRMEDIKNSEEKIGAKKQKPMKLATLVCPNCKNKFSIKI